MVSKPLEILNKKIFFNLIFYCKKGTLSNENFLNKLLFETQTNFINHQTCILDIDCTSGFICKNFDCIAKKQDGDLCLSGRDEECQCGKCVTDEQSWNQICFNDHECENEGNGAFISIEIFKMYNLFFLRKNNL